MRRHRTPSFCGTHPAAVLDRATRPHPAPLTVTLRRPARFPPGAPPDHPPAVMPGQVGPVMPGYRPGGGAAGSRGPAGTGRGMATSAPAAAAAPVARDAPARAGLVLTSLIVVAAMANLNLSVANVALPSLLGMALSAPACLLAAFAPSDTVLIAARVLGGVSAGMALPTTLALVTALWSGPARTRAIAPARAGPERPASTGRRDAGPGRQAPGTALPGSGHGRPGRAQRPDLGPARAGPGLGAGRGQGQRPAR